MANTSSASIAPVSIGTGPDKFVLGLSEDAYLGNAQFTIVIDGVQVGGVQTVAGALHASGQSQLFTINGTFGNGTHTVAIDFLNDAYGGSSAKDRNLYLDSLSYNGTTIAENAKLGSNGTKNFQVQGALKTPAALSVGTGPDSFVLQLAEDAWQGDAQFAVYVNGVQIGGVLTATAIHGAGQSQALTVNGNFGTGAQTVSVKFLNDAYGGSAATDRNLYVNSISYKGTTVTENAELKSNGTQTYKIAATSVAAPIVLPTVALASETLAHDTGTSASDQITSNGTVTLKGTETGTAGTTVSIYDGTTNLGQATLNGSGAWTYTTTLGNGTHSLHAVAADPQGHAVQSAAASPITVVASGPVVGLTGDSLSANFVTGATAITSAVSASTTSTSTTLSMTLANAATVPVPTETLAGGAFTVGVNLSGMEYNGGASAQAYYDYAVPSQQELAYYHSQGNDLIRLPISWETLQPTLGGALNQTYLSEIEGVVNQAAALGMKVIIDMHDYGGYGSDKLGNGTLTDAQFANVWQQVATTFAGNPGIGGYDLMNEPNGMPNATAWPDAAQAAITAIRTADRSTAIYVEGDDWSSAGSWAENNPTLANLFDPSNNLVFSAHLYLDTDNSGTHFDWAQQAAAGDTTQLGVQQLSDFVGWLQANNLKGDIGEIGAGNDSADWLASLDNTLAYAKASNLQVTYWGGGPWLGSYPLSVEPGVDGTPAPQMAVLDKYTGAYATVASAALTGTGAANSTIYLSEDGTLLATTTTNANGAWAYTLTGLANGVHTIVAGDTPPASDGTISALTFDLEAATPTTKVASYNISLAGTVQSATGTSVEIFSGATDLGAATVNNGAWTYTTILPTGTYALSAVATDTAGNKTTTALATLQSGTSGNDTLTTSGGANLLSGNGGADTYTISAQDTADRIVNGVATGTAASGALDMGVASNRLWFVESGNNLVVDVLGTNQQVTIQNWYANTTTPWEQLSKVVGSDAMTLDAGLQNLVQAMAAFSAANGGFNPLTTTHTTTGDSYFGSGVQAAVAANWHK